MMRTFDLTAPLPGPGRTVVEASAGTGKTYAVAALATRYIAEEVVGLDALLLITFSRAATAELRDRVRRQFAEAAEALGREERGEDSDLIRHLRQGDPLQVDRRRRRLLDALANYDAATIATTHEFCNAVLRSLGVAGDSDATSRLLQDVTGLREEVIGDLYLARFSEGTDPPLTFRTAGRTATEALENPHARLHDDLESLPEADQAQAGARVAFAAATRAEVERRKKRQGLITFDDMLSRLAGALEVADSPAARRMRERWQVVIVDEFQDTDPVQWQVLERAFLDPLTGLSRTSGPARLILIGDPKQAIYAFRGGDTPTYLRAIEGADRQTLSVNHRSDAPVVDGLQALLGGAALGDDRITVTPVEAAHQGSRLHHLAGGVVLRQLRREHFSVTKSGGIRAADWRAHVPRDVAAEIARSLSCGATYEGRPLTAGDIAVLVPEHRDVAPIQAELDELGIASVVTAPQSVMTGEAAQHWRNLLAALEAPHREGLVRTAALGPFFGERAEHLAAGGDDLTDRVAERLRGWLDLFRTRGVAGILGAVQAEGLAARVLARSGGERLLTDLLHIGQLLHEAAAAERLGLTGLLGWLREAIEEGNRNDTRRRRLDVDAEAVQFVTIHGAKGLEYPIVHLPYLFDRSDRDWATTHRFHLGEERMLDLCDTETGRLLAKEEDAQERLRTAYVAMTRASARLVMWWAPTWNAPHGSLTRFLFGRQPDASGVATAAEVPAGDEEVDAVLAGWQARGAFVVEPSIVGELPTPPPPSPAPPLAARPWTRALDLEWRRTSYSGLIRAEDAAGLVASEPEETGTVDEEPGVEEPDLAMPTDPAASGPAEDAPASPLDAWRGGATFGSLVHAVLEHADPQAPDLPAELARHIEEHRRWWAVEGDTDDLAAALVPMQHTPLGPLAGQRSLADIGLPNRLRELDFEIPMAGGDDVGAAGGSAPRALPLRAMADALRRHLAADDPMRAYADRLEVPSLGDQLLRGYLSGSIDVVLRIDDRFLVVDYKTNSLGTPGEPATTADYTPEAVTAAMLHSHYPLQALLYSVVLHRYLRWRLPGYDPSTHLGGVLYLYVRGMAGAQTPVIDDVPCGVFSWRPPAALVEELSQILEGAR